MGFINLLQTQVNDLKKRLRSTEDDLKKSQSDTTKYMDTIKEVFSKVNPHMEATEAKAEVLKKEEDLATAQDSSSSSTNATASDAAAAVNGSESTAAAAEDKTEKTQA